MSNTCISITKSAKLLKCSRQTVYRYINDGSITRSKDFSGNPCIEVSELLRFNPNIEIDTELQNKSDDINHAVTNNETLLQQEILYLKREVELINRQTDEFRSRERKHLEIIAGLTLRIESNQPEKETTNIKPSATAKTSKNEDLPPYTPSTPNEPNNPNNIIQNNNTGEETNNIRTEEEPVIRRRESSTKQIFNSVLDAWSKTQKR